MFNFLNYLILQHREYENITRKYGPPSITHIHVIGRNSFLSLFLNIFKSVPYFITEHSSTYYAPNKSNSFLKKVCCQLLLDKAKEVTTVSNYLAGLISRLTNHEITVIPNVVSRQFFEAENIGAGSNTRKSILHIANYRVATKQNDKIIHIFNKLASGRDDFELKMIGAGEDEEYLKEIASECSYLENRIEFIHEMTVEDLVVEMKHADVLVLYSRNETQGVVLLEAMTIGLPYVAPKIGGIPEHSEKRGLLFEPENEHEFLKNVELILDGNFQPDLKEWRKYAESKFSSTAVAGEFISSYQKHIS